MTKRLVMVALMTLCGCAEDPPPSCQQAVTHFYGVGCAFYDLRTNPPAQYSLSQSILDCQAVNQAVPDRCQEFFDDYMRCLNTVANSAVCASCSDESDQLFGCQ